MATILWPKILLSLGLGLLCLPRPLRTVRKWVTQTNTLKLGLWFIVIRLVIFFIVFVALDMRLPTDVREYFYPQAGNVLLGMVPNIDFASSYNIGFPYLLALSTMVVNSALSIIVLMILAEWGAFVVFARLFRGHAKETGSSVLAWWFVNPISVIYITLGGQDEAVILLVACLTIWLLYRNQHVLSGSVGILGFVCTKLLSGIILIPWLAFPFTRTWRTWVTIAAGCALISVISLFTSLQIIGAAREIGKISSGNLWTLAAEILGPDYLVTGVWTYAVYPVALIPVLWKCVRSPWSLDSQVMRIWGIAGILFMILSPKTFGMYFLMFLPGAIWLCNTLPRRLSTLYGVVFFPLVVIGQTLWFYAGKENVFNTIPSLSILVISVDILLVAGNITLVIYGLRRTMPAMAS